MFDFKKILKRFKEELNLKHDREIAEILGVEQQNITNWKARNSIPYDLIISFCLEKEINMIYILTGKKDSNSLKNDENLSKTQKEITEKIKNLDPIQQKLILNKIDNEILKNEEKEIELLKNNILKYFSDINSTHKIILEEFERDEETLRAVYISDDWNLDLENETYIEDNKKSFVELLKMLLENVKENKGKNILKY
ncbi:MAG: helix-turn-helix domain-containing protein [Candidatus Altimarinota bacterium]